VTLIYNGGSVTATLRTVNNERAPVQVKYEGAVGAAFRAWLATVFRASLRAPCGEYLELRKLGPDSFEVVPFPVGRPAFPTLRVSDWLFHGGVDKLSERDFPRNEIAAVVHNVQYDEAQGQAYYNRQFAKVFQSWAWATEQRVIPELGLKCDFAKGAVRAEVEFGNARTYYQDYVKFLIAERYTAAKVGVLIVPAEAFARHLCAVGRARAAERGRPQYSGMVHFQKVRREFAYLEFLLAMPVAVAAIGPPPWWCAPMDAGAMCCGAREG